MKAYNRILAIIIVVIISLFISANVILHNRKEIRGRPYIVEVSRLIHEIEENKSIPLLDDCEYVINIELYSDDFYNPDCDYVIREVDGILYRFDYVVSNNIDKSDLIFDMNIILGIMTLLIISVMIYIKLKILHPFDHLKEVPYELSKGNLTSPIKEFKNRFFGRFVWGIDMLRENMEQQKERELNLQRDKKMLMLSLSHDIKTPLSAIKLYSKALSKGLYPDKEKQIEVAESINKKADEIERYVSQIISASRDEFLTFDVNMGEFYLSELVTKIKVYYTEKLSLIKIGFIVGEYGDCLISGDLNRCVEVLQNIIENAIKYGDGKYIDISFSEEDGCILVTVKNSGCTLPDTDITHIFESFWRGENAENEKGSGLGLYICRQLMRKMNGEVFARINNEDIYVTTVLGKA